VFPIVFIEYNILHRAKNKNTKRPWPAESRTLAYALSSLSTWVRSTSSRITHGQSGTDGANASAAGVAHGYVGEGGAHGVAHGLRVGGGGSTEACNAKLKVHFSSRCNARAFLLVTNKVAWSEQLIPSKIPESQGVRRQRAELNGPRPRLLFLQRFGRLASLKAIDRTPPASVRILEP
jgi:hypothetical protein